MKIKKIALDLDDVLNDFTMPALQIVGCEVSGPRDYNSYNLDWGFNIIKAANSLHKTRSFTNEEFWDCFSVEDWASFPESEEFHAILDMSIKLVGENILILTSPICGRDVSISATSKCLEGKYLWIRKHLPNFLHRSFSFSPAKHFYATPSTLLIDDSGENVRNFKRAGGQAILFPRPWNNVHGADPLNHVKRGIHRILSE